MSEHRAFHYQATISLGNLLTIAALIGGTFVFALKYENRLTIVEGAVASVSAERHQIVAIASDVAVLKSNVEMVIDG